MDYTDPKNYSILNSYDFSDKNRVNSFLDWASTPCRRVLGGRNVYLKSLQWHDKMSTAKKVAVIFFSVLIFPIAIISLASLAVKVITLPWIWEKKKMASQVTQTTNAYNQFILACNQNRHNDALTEIAKIPQLAQKRDVNNALFNAINMKINNNDSWDEIQDSLRLLSTGDAVTLIDHAVKLRLDNEFKNNNAFMKGDDISDLMINSLVGKDAIKECCDKLISSSLNVDVASGKVVLNARKMELADHVFTYRTRMMQNFAENDVEYRLIPIIESNERDNLFAQSSNAGMTLQYRMMFKSIPDMRQIHDALDDIRSITLLGQNALDAINNTISQAQSIDWSMIRQNYATFDNAIRGLSISQDDTNILDYYKKSYNNVFDLIDIFLKDETTEDDVAKAKAIQESCQQPNLADLQQTQGYQSLLDSMLEQLHLQRAVTITEIEKLISGFILTESEKIFNNFLNSATL